MSVFDPESRERRESFFEANKFTANFEQKLLDALDSGKETFPDLVQCPVASCRTPVDIRNEGDVIVVECPNCGWIQVVQKRTLS